MHPVYWHGAWYDTEVHERDGLAVGQSLAGPAIIHEPGGTTALPPGWVAEIEAYGSMLCRRNTA